MKPLVLALSLVFLSALSAQESRVPSKVVSLTLMTDEFLVELLPADRIRALSRSVDDPVLSNAAEAGRTVKDRAWLDLEVLIRLKPDLILAADWSDAGDLDFLRAKGYQVFVVKTPRTWAEVKERIASLGTLLGRSEAAQALLARLAAREKALSGRVPAKKVTVLEYNSFGSSMGSGTLWNEMTGLAGVVNLSAGLSSDEYGFAPLSRELLVKLDPDWLILPSPDALVSYGQPGFLDELRSDPLYKSLRAVKTGHVLYLSEALKTTTSHAVLGAAEVLQHAAYPDLR